MRNFDYVRVREVSEAVEVARSVPGAAFMAGGTNLVDLMRAGVVQPRTVVDLNALPMTEIGTTSTGGIRIGALASNTAAASDGSIRTRAPLVARSILSGASAQLRNMATVGGNLLQKTRCPYFYDLSSPCNKRRPGAGCAALRGLNRSHAVLGGSDECIATNPSDLAVALIALDADIEVHGANGVRRTAIEGFHLEPHQPVVETILKPGEVVTAVVVPPAAPAVSRYRKVRDRSSFAFALVSIALWLRMEEGRVSELRLAFGGVATRPWRARTAETLLLGRRPTDQVVGEAADAELERAVPRAHNAFKVELLRRTLVAVMRDASREAGRQ